jgi:hypothetical protein
MAGNLKIAAKQGGSGRRKAGGTIILPAAKTNVYREWPQIAVP